MNCSTIRNIKTNINTNIRSINVKKWLQKFTVFKTINNVLKCLRVSLVGTVFIHHTLRYAFLGDYDQRIVELIHALSKKSPLYVKIFQALAGSTGLLSDNVQKYMVTFSDNVPFTVDDYDTEALRNYLDEIGEKYPEVKINSLSLVPIHSGTISLVYEGLMNNKPVVVKYVRNGIKEKMEKALIEAEYLIKIIELIPSLRMFNLHTVLNENRKFLIEQTSMKVELKNMNDFFEKTKERYYIRIPKPYDVYTENNESVLVMEKLIGRKIDELRYDEKENYGLLLARNTIETIMVDGLYHGDLHRGNILFMENTISDNIVNDNTIVKQLGLLDFGIIGRLNDCERLTISSFFLSLGMKKYEDVVNNLLGSLANKNVIDKMDKSKYNDMIAELVDITETACVSRDGFGAKELTKINKIIEKNGLELDPIFCIIEMALAMNATVCKELDTNHRNFMSYLHEVIQEKIDLTMFDV